MILKALLAALVIPTLLALAYYYIPEVENLVNSWLEFKKPVIRFVDSTGRKIYVSSLEAVPIEYRESAEVNPNLPHINRGEFQPVATPTPLPTPKKRGGDGVIKRDKSGKKSKGFDSFEGAQPPEKGRSMELDETLPYKSVFDALTEKLETIN